MSDIPARLRDPQFDGPLNAEAAREVKRLRAEIGQLRQDRQALLDTTELNAKIVEGLGAKVVRLRAIVAQMPEDVVRDY